MFACVGAISRVCERKLILTRPCAEKAQWHEPKSPSRIISSVFDCCSISRRILIRVVKEILKNSRAVKPRQKEQRRFEPSDLHVLYYAVVLSLTLWRNSVTDEWKLIGSAEISPDHSSLTTACERPKQRCGKVIEKNCNWISERSMLPAIGISWTNRHWNTEIERNHNELKIILFFTPVL